MKQDALELADKLHGLNSCEPVIIKACEDIIRKLVAELDKAEPAILDAFNSGKGVGYVDGMKAVKSKPLNDEYVFICKRCGDELNIKYEEQKND